MPRTTKRTQPPTAPQDQGYGVRGEQIAAQGAMPLPDNRSGGVPAETAAPVPGAAPGAPAPAVTNPQDLLRMLQEQAPPPPGGLSRPSERPDEHVTAGLGMVDPAITPGSNKAADVLDQMAAVTGDPRFTAMAQRARAL